MTPGRLAAAIGAAIAVIAGSTTGILLTGDSSTHKSAAISAITTTVSSIPAAPANLEQTKTTETSIGIAWGPSQPSNFTVSAYTKTVVTMKWKASQDSRGAVTYTVVKNGVIVKTGLTLPTWKAGVTSRTASFRMCVFATNVKGQKSASGCATVKRPTI